jgi:hypothetical protein
MTRAGTAWARWVAWCGREEDARTQALVRVLAPLMIVLDLGRAWQLGLLETLFRPYAAGGINKIRDSAFVLDLWLSDDVAGLAAVGVTLVSFSLASAGLAARPALIVGVLAYAQVGHLFPPGDRAIDRILRTVLLLWAFGQSHRRWSLSPQPALARVPAWPADVARFLMVLIYLSAGVGKLMVEPAWLAWSGTPVLYRVMTDPLAAHLDPVAMQAWFVPLRVMGWATIALELSAPLILTRWVRWWAIPGAIMHLGIHAAMDLGMFSWGMLSLYPLLWTRAEATEARDPARA